MKILYVEDNPDNIYMLTRRLKKKGFEMIIAGDGQEGIDMALEEKPDLILMDLSLPTMDGWTATEKINEIIKLNSDKKIQFHVLDSFDFEVLFIFL